MSEITEIKVGKYRHFKGGLYTVIGVATNSENLGKVVVYQDEVSGKLWVRPASMWNDVINGKKRFELINNEQGKEKKQLCVGDEIRSKVTNRIGFVSHLADIGVNVVWADGGTSFHGYDKLEKTGRYYPQVVEILKTMGEKAYDSARFFRTKLD